MPPLEQIGMFGIVEGNVMPLEQAKKKIEERKSWIMVSEKPETFEHFRELHGFLCSTLINSKLKAINGIEKETNKKYVNTWKQIRLKSGIVGAKELNELKQKNRIEYLERILKYISKAMEICSLYHKHFSKAEYYAKLKLFKERFPNSITKENLEEFELFLTSKLKTLG